MQGASEEPPGWSELLEEFRRLGGTVENVCMRRGAHGRGLFALDPARPVQLHTPPNLLLPVEDAAFKDGRFHISPSAKMGSAEKIWLEHYMNEFSWGRGGREEALATVQGMHSLPMRIREILARTFDVGFYVLEPSEDLVQQHFLASRVITYENCAVIMPMIELVNHGRAPGYDCTNGIAVRGNFADEVLVNYSDQDAFGCFASWGIVCHRGLALSIPTVVWAASGEIAVSCDPDDGQLVEIRLQNPIPMKLPRVTIDGSRIRLSFLLLGMKGFPRIPKGIFRRILRDAGRQQDDEAFEMAQYANRAAFLGLLNDLEGFDGPLVGSLRSVCLMQLDALNQCFGVRPI